jgi:hypothetical protein
MGANHGLTGLRIRSAGSLVALVLEGGGHWADYTR